MKNYIIIGCCLILCCSAFWACKKELNVYPTTSEVDGNVIVDAKSASAALNGVYFRFANAGADNNGVPSVLWVDVNEGNPSELSGLLTYPFGGSDFSDHTYTPASFEALAMWNYGYNIVNAANGFLKNIAPVTTIAASLKQQMIGEAKFLRAYANSYLLLYFGQFNDMNSAFGIILRNEFVTPGSINLPRVSVAETYDSILADLDNAIAYLPGNNTQIWYANVWAAKLLKARVLMNRAVGNDYAAVISITSDIITNSPFLLEQNEKDIFQTLGLASKEVMLGIQPYTAPPQTYKYSDYIFYGQFAPSEALVSLFNSDPRRSWTMDTVTTLYYGNLLGFIKYYPGSLTDINPMPLTENSYAFRLTEAYLLQAEALALSGGSLPQAKMLLKTVMGHAGITDFSAVDEETTAAGLQLLIVQEEMRSFVGEDGQDWFAVRRLPFATLQNIIPTIGTQDLLVLPIPQTEITANSSMKQNPGY